MINKDLLKEVLSLQTSTENDSAALVYITNFVDKLGLKTKRDAFGNLYVTKGKPKKGYPCMISHVDTVHKILKDFKVFEHKGTLFAYSIDTCGQVGIGGDDKVGIYACLQALKDFDNIKVAFFRKEEIGCVGSGKANMKFFDDCNFVLQLDRKGYKDFSINAAGVDLSSDKFKEAVRPSLKKWKFDEVRTSLTDVTKLKMRGLNVSATNISSGYYYPHTDSEMIILNDVNRAYSLAHSIITKHGSTRFEHKWVKPKYVPVNKNESIVPWTGFSSKLKNTPVPENEKDRSIQYNYFQKYPGNYIPHMYRFIGAVPVKHQYKYLFLPHRNILYDLYADRPVQSLAEMKEVYKDLVIKDNGKEFVFSWLAFDWMDKSQAKWFAKNKSWWLKSCFDRWNDLKGRGTRRRKHYLTKEALTERYVTPPLIHTTGLISRVS